MSGFNPRPAQSSGATADFARQACAYAWFQSAPRSVERGDASTVLVGLRRIEFQSAPRSVERGDR